MLADFQQALADVTASPELCIRARQDPSVLQSSYELTDREYRRLAGIVAQPGMQCACIVYRANRLAPLAGNIPRTLRALGKDLRPVLSEFWAEFPETNVHFLYETERFCRWLKAKLDEGLVLGLDVAPILALDSEEVHAAIQDTYTEGQ